MSTSSERKKVKRKIIKIDKELCTGCGKCVVGCEEGALEIIDGKAEVVNERFCDGLGACIGECPEGALSIEEREAYEFDEELMEQNQEQVKGESEEISIKTKECSCPSSDTITYDKPWQGEQEGDEIPSALRQWPIKLELVNPEAPFFDNNELVLVSDCSPLAYGDFHRKILQGRPIITICPMLNLGESEIEKIEQILKSNPISQIEVVLMEVPCCRKLHIFLDTILEGIDRDIEVQETIVSRDGEIKEKHS
jgi:ferredoxin